MNDKNFSDWIFWAVCGTLIDVNYRSLPKRTTTLTWRNVNCVCLCCAANSIPLFWLCAGFQTKKKWKDKRKIEINFRLVITAVSPNVVIDIVIWLKTEQLGLYKGIHTIIITMTSGNDVLSIFFFNVVLGMIFSTGMLMQPIITLSQLFNR